MASNTKTLQNSIDWAKWYIGQRPLTLDTTMEPALTAANTVIQTMLQPPFKWRWNRKSTSFSMVSTTAWAASTAYALGYRLKDSNGNMQTVTSIGSSPHESGSSTPSWATSGTTTDGDLTWTESALTDYVQAVSDFGFIEKATVTDSNGKIVEIPNIATELSMDAGSGRPSTIAPIIDDNAGNITFRFMPGVPDQAYTCQVIYQKSVTNFSALTGSGGTWPIPDSYGHVYNWGFLGFVYLFASDPRAAFALQRFVVGLLALSEGLTEQQKNVFLEQWNMLTASAGVPGAKYQQGIQARGA